MKRHHWQVISRNRSVFNHSTVSRCQDCSLERRQYLDFGHHRTAFRIAGAWVESKTPACKPIEVRA